MMLIRPIFALALLISAIGPAWSADPVFPPGSRVGITPLVGLTSAKTFAGFETEDQGVKVLVVELPTDAYNEVMKAFKANPAGAGGVKPESIETAAGLAYYTTETGKDGATKVRRYSLILSGGTFSGYVAVQVAEAESKTFNDDLVRQDVCHCNGAAAGAGGGAALLHAVQGRGIERLQDCPDAGRRRGRGSGGWRSKRRHRGGAVHADRLDRLTPTSADIADVSPSRRQPQFRGA